LTRLAKTSTFDLWQPPEKEERKSKEMKLRVTLNSGLVIYPVFNPEHELAVLAYYEKELATFGILDYQLITN
jgi:hypothetical protein